MADLTEVAKNSIKGAVKSTAKLLLPWILIIVTVLVMCGAFLYVIDGDAFEKGSSSSKSYQSSAQIKDGKVEVSKDNIINNALIEKGYTQEEINNMTEDEKKSKLGLSDINLNDASAATLMWELYNDVYSQYLSSAEELAKLMNAELITQYPDTRANPNEIIDWNNVDFTSSTIPGIVKIKRKTDNTEKMLVYRTQADFESLVNSNNDGAKNYFSLDDQNNLLIATYEKTTNTVTTNDNFNITAYTSTPYTKTSSGTNTVYKNEEKKLNITKINYQALIPQKYKMPFSYLWGLLIYSGDKNFVLEVADLVMNSEIELTVHDNVTTEAKEDIYTYKKQTRKDINVVLKIENTQGITYNGHRFWMGTEKVNNYPQNWTDWVNELPSKELVKVTSPNITSSGSRNNAIRK